MKRIWFAAVFATASGIAAASIPLSVEPVIPDGVPSALPLLPEGLGPYDRIDPAGDEQALDEPYCDAHQTLTRKLYVDFSESLGETATLEAGRSLEMWYSDMLGTWTRLYVRPDGIACVMATGTFEGTGGAPMDIIASHGV